MLSALLVQNFGHDSAFSSHLLKILTNSFDLIPDTAELLNLGVMPVIPFCGLLNITGKHFGHI